MKLICSSICIVSLLRVVYISRMDLHDFAYTYADLGMWSIVEPQLGVINACLPVMRPIIHQAMKSKAYQRLVPSSAGPFDQSTSQPKPPNGTDGYIPHNTVDKLYPLDSVHLVGSSDSGVDLEGVGSKHLT
jgi:hypothetical protein